MTRTHGKVASMAGWRCGLLPRLSLWLSSRSRAAFAAGAGRRSTHIPGLRIYGFDPVAYFTDGGPSAGPAEFEYRLAGATWRFRNEGNRAAFADHPEVYMPQFGGYDPVASRAASRSPGHPPLGWSPSSGSICFMTRRRARISSRSAVTRDRDARCGAGREFSVRCLTIALLPRRRAPDRPRR